MNKTIKTLFLVIVLSTMLFALAIPLFAKNSNALVVDNEGLFTSAQEAELEAYLYQISEKYQCELVVVTARSFGYYDAQEYAENYYDTHGYGYGSDASGVLLLISESERYYYICTTGEAIDIFNRKNFNSLSSSVEDLLGEDRFYDASMEFARKCDTILYNYKVEGKTFDTTSFITGIVVSFIIGIVAGIITVLVLKRKMNNARAQRHASYYEKQGSFDLRVSRDMYLYSTIRRTARPKSNSSSSRGGGRSHGGGGGRF